MSAQERKSGIVRVSKRENGYAVIDTYFLSDDRLSFKAKGVLSYLLSKPNGWQVFVADLVKRSKDGRDSVYSALRELEAAGYVERRQMRDEQTQRITGVETIVYERPIMDEPGADIPHTEIPDKDEPITDKPTQVINDLSITDSKRKVSKSAEIILDTLAKELRKLPLNDTSSLYEFYFEDIYAMLTRRFPGQLEPEVIRIAGERYFNKAIDMRTGLPKIDVSSPTGLFFDVYNEALAECQAKSYRNKNIHE
ncbi:helix-turn-helix domain-containing protein [Paenibacillus sp. 453mf]|uniref:helix-turn-helix domain-containing protein n=1 Tax=Paenibacillus sp. 453mf TaxID=1761874 RepID=UPI0008E05020|nr:helix-turn-helix domain-containing protein [Paenibacillus sp. 453mf]SFS76063.1 hypothetical protein SAMN04488601_10332 [Paenibacillus sp. 453mf]